MAKKKPQWTFIPKADVTAVPERGGVFQIYRKYWWALTENDEVMFYTQFGSPQCNSNKQITERLVAAKTHPSTHVEQLDTVFLPHDCRDYV